MLALSPAVMFTIAYGALARRPTTLAPEAMTRMADQIYAVLPLNSQKVAGRLSVAAAPLDMKSPM